MKDTSNFFACDQDPSKTCPSKASMRIETNGQISLDCGKLLLCCVAQDQIKEAQKFFADK